MPAAAHGAGSVRKESRTPIPASSGWKRDVIDPGDVVYPRAIYAVGNPGAAQNTGGLKARGGAAASITSTGLSATGIGSTALVVDLGTNVGGYVEIGVKASSGVPIRLGYSEAL